MAITAEAVRKLRDMSGQGMMECKKALEEAGGDQTKALELLRKKGFATAEKRVGRATANGIIHTYIHHNKRIGVLVQVNCETDFVARNTDFIKFADDLSKHIAAFSPIAVSRSQVDLKIVESEREIAKAQVVGKPANIIDKIVEGKLDKYFAERVLLEQPWIHDDKQSVGDVLKILIGKIGENMTITQFARFDVGVVPSEE
jgi:elongation factor Ts